MILKTGGGSKRQGLGKGIHWHIENRVLYYSSDLEQQIIPYVRVYNDDGTYSEFVDIESGFDPSSIKETDLKDMDCITCHNRITHLVPMPEVSVDSSINLKLIDVGIPEIRRQSIEVLRGAYTSETQGLNRIAALDDFYKSYYPDYYSQNQEKIQTAIKAVQDIYTSSVYLDQKSDWNTHPNNVGHRYTPGCFRCHDGKHLDANNESVPLECNLCHSIPVVAGAQDFVTDIEISRGPEPESHLSSNWIGLHRDAFDSTCSTCHNTSNPGGTDNTSFCSNSACHSNVWEFAGFNAPKLREILQSQIPPTPTPSAPIGGSPLTYEATFGPLLKSRCGACHTPGGMMGLDLTSYAGLMKGGTNGSVIVSGDPANSLIVQKQSQPAGHFGQLDAQELEALKQWIQQGAPEK